MEKTVKDPSIQDLLLKSCYENGYKQAVIDTANRAMEIYRKNRCKSGVAIMLSAMALSVLIGGYLGIRDSKKEEAIKTESKVEES